MKNKSGKGVVFIGLIVMVIAIVGFLVVGNLMNPPSATAFVASQDIAQGTSLADLPDAVFQAVPVGESSELTASLVSKNDLAEMKAAGGVFVVSVLKGDPITKTMIASSANAAGATNPSLANSDPNMVIVHLVASDLVPEGIRPGDRLDVSVAISSIRFDEAYALSVANIVSKATREGESIDQFSGSLTEEDYNNTQLAGGSDLLNDEDMLAYYFQAPLAKTIVQNAKVVNVFRKTNSTVSVDSSTGQAVSQTSQGSIESIDILIPRDSVEWVAMAQAAGQLTLSLLSPTADDTIVPTIGVSLQDLIDTFYASRGLSVEETITR